MTISVHVAAMNDAPVANAGSAGGNEDTSITGILIGSDVEGDALTWSIVTPPQHGAVQIGTLGSFVYTPAANFFGADSFTFLASDGELNSAPAKMSLECVR